MKVVNVCSNDGCSRRTPATESRMKLCGKCKTNYYCSADCQREDWPSHRSCCINDKSSKRICRKIQNIAARMFEEKKFFENIFFDSKLFDLTIKYLGSSADATELPCDFEILDALTRGIRSVGNGGVATIGRFGFFLAEIPESVRETRDTFVIDIVSGEANAGYTLCSLEIKKILC